MVTERGKVIPPWLCLGFELSSAEERGAVDKPEPKSQFPITRLLGHQTPFRLGTGNFGGLVQSGPSYAQIALLVVSVIA